VLKPTLRDTSDLDAALKSAFEDLKAHDADSEQYAKTLTQIERLSALRFPKKESKGITADALLGVVSNLLGIGLILGYEKANVITTKALGFVTKYKP